jgi:hypothetical protein
MSYTPNIGDTSQCASGCHSHNITWNCDDGDSIKIYQYDDWSASYKLKATLAGNAKSYTATTVWNESSGYPNTRAIHQNDGAMYYVVNTAGGSDYPSGNFGVTSRDAPNADKIKVTYRTNTDLHFVWRNNFNHPIKTCVGDVTGHQVDVYNGVTHVYKSSPTDFTVSGSSVNVSGLTTGTSYTVSIKTDKTYGSETPPSLQGVYCTSSGNSYQTPTLYRDARFHAYATAGMGIYATYKAASGTHVNRVFFGGGFQNMNGVTGKNYFVCLNKDTGALDYTFNSGGTGFNGAVYSIIPDIVTAGKLLVAGDFTSYNGTSTPRKIVRLNSDGTLDTSWASGGTTNGYIHKIKNMYDTDIYVMGNFTTFGGQNHGHVARLNKSTGAINATFQSSFATGANGLVTSMCEMTGSYIAIGGLFSSVNYNARKNLCVINSSGSVYGTASGCDGNNLMTGTNDAVMDLLYCYDNNKILAVGNFTEVYDYGGSTNSTNLCSGIAELNGGNSNLTLVDSFNPKFAGCGRWDGYSVWNTYVQSVIKTTNYGYIVNGSQNLYNCQYVGNWISIDINGTLSNSVKFGHATFQSTYGIAVDGYDVYIGGLDKWNGLDVHTVAEPYPFYKLSNTPSGVYATASSGASTCHDTCDATITFHNQSGATKYEYSIDSGATWQATSGYTGVCSGAHGCYIRESGYTNNFYYVGIITIPNPAALMPSITGSTNTSWGVGYTYLTASGKNDYVWAITGGTIVSGGTTYHPYVWWWASNGNISVNYKNGTCLTDTKTISVTNTGNCTDWCGYPSVISNRTTTTITLSWTNIINNPPFIWYSNYVRIAYHGGATIFETDLPTSATTYTFTGLTQDTLFDVYNGWKEQDIFQSPCVKYITGRTYSATPTPTNVYISNEQCTSLILNWTNHPESQVPIDANIIEEYYGGSWHFIANTWSGTSQAILSFPTSTSHLLRVSARDAVYATYYSSASVNGTTLTCLPPPFCGLYSGYTITNATCGNSNGKIRINNPQYYYYYDYYDFVLTDVNGNNHAFNTATSEFTGLTSNYYFLTATAKPAYWFFYGRETCTFDWIRIETSDTGMVNTGISVKNVVCGGFGKTSGRIAYTFTDTGANPLYTGKLYDYETHALILTVTGNTVVRFIFSPLDASRYYMVLTNGDGCTILIDDTKVDGESLRSVGGIKRLWLTEWTDAVEYIYWSQSDEDYYLSDVDANFFNSIKIKTYIDYTLPSVWYSVNVQTKAITFSQGMNKTHQGFIFSDKLSMIIPHSDNAKWRQLVDILVKRYILVFEDNNGLYWTMGYRHGAQVSGYKLNNNEYTLDFYSVSENKILTNISKDYVINSIL